MWPAVNELPRLITWLRTPVLTTLPEPEETVVVAGAPPGPLSGPPAPPDQDSALKDVIRTVVAAVATAVGTVGLLAVVGGAVTWLRMSETGLPTQTALSVTPKTDLVGLGATGLVIFAGIAILAVAGLYAVDPTGVGRGTLLAAFLLVVAALLSLGFAGDFGGESIVILIVAIIALAAACLQISASTGRRFVPFGVAVFFSVLLFGAAVTYRTESDHPKVQPAAVLRGEEPTGLVGFFVAATDDRIYIARLTRGTRPGALYNIKRDDTTRLAVGRRMRCEGRGVNVKCADAHKAAIALRKQLLADRRRTTSKPTAKKKAKA